MILQIRVLVCYIFFFFFSSRRRHTRFDCDWSSDVCSSDLVTMLIGNNPKVSLSLFAPQYTMAAVIANEFTEAADELYLDALIEIGLVLFIITLVVNSLSRLLIWSMARSAKAASVAAMPAEAIA